MPREHRSVVKRRFKAWQKARKGLLEHIGEDLMEPENEGKLLEKVKALFDQFDADRSQGIDSNELQLGMKALGIKLSKEEAAAMLSDADEDNDGFIQLEEFQTVVKYEIERYLKSREAGCKCTIM